MSRRRVDFLNPHLEPSEQEDFRKTVLAVFEPRLTHELERMIAAIDPKSKGATIPTPGV